MRKLVVTVAVAGSLGVGGVAGVLLGTPSLSHAQGTAVQAGDPLAAVPQADPAAGSQGTPAGPMQSALDDALKGLVDKGTITQAQADAVKDAVAAERKAHAPLGKGVAGRLGLGAELKTAADTLGMTPADLMTELRSGKSLADVAKAKNVPVDKLIDALVGEANTRIDTAVKNNKLTPDQAAKLKGNLKDKITQAVNGTLPMGPGRRGPGRGRFGANGNGGTTGNGNGGTNGNGGSATVKPSTYTTM